MTCPVIFRDSDDNKQEATILYEGFEDDRGRFVVTMCKVIDLFEDEVKSGDQYKDIQLSMEAHLNCDWVIIDCEIEFEIMEANEKREAA